MGGSLALCLASADQVAIDAVAAKLMGFDPMKDCKFIRLAHELGLGCGDPSQIEIVGGLEAAKENWHFEGPFKKMTFASSMQHKIYWGGLKNTVEWSLKTWLAPWSYIASVLYHDSYWYPRHSREQMAACLESEWGRLFQNWGHVTRTAQGYRDIGASSAEFHRNTMEMLAESVKILGTCLKEAPEREARKRAAATR